MIPSSDGTITACRNNQSGALRVIDAEAGQTCKASETQLTWKDAMHGKVADSDKLDGLDSSAFLGANQKAADSDKLDGLDSTNFLPDGNLPAGTTLRGRYDIFGNNSTGSSEEFGADGISFVYTFRSLPQAHFIRYGTTPPPECPGMAGSPEALPGHLCVYEQARENIATGWPTFYVLDPYGFGVWAPPLIVGHYRSYGTWAVTAPNAAQVASVEERSDAATSSSLEQQERGGVGRGAPNARGGKAGSDVKTKVATQPRGSWAVHQQEIQSWKPRHLLCRGTSHRPSYLAAVP